jgi:hypothetical protein
LPPDKLAAFVARLEAEKETRIQRLIDEGKAVRILAHKFEDESDGFAQQRALAQHPPPDGEVPIFDLHLIKYAGGPLSPSEPRPFDCDTARKPESERWHGHQYSPPRAPGPPPQPVRIDHDGGIVEGWFTLSSDNVVQLCNMFGSPEPGEDPRHRISASNDFPDRVAKILLRRKVMGRDDGFGREIHYPRSATP